MQGTYFIFKTEKLPFLHPRHINITTKFYLTTLHRIFFYNISHNFLRSGTDWVDPADTRHLFAPFWQIYTNTKEHSRRRRPDYCSVWRIRDVYPGSQIRLFSIPDPGSELSPSRIPDPHQRI